ncbi:MAG: Hsp20 family protein, partial [Anaerolineales bacterium]|nr:Hsp20 family protein [Anaerolineales bacterium]
RFPVDVNSEAVTASYENGVLTLTVPKAEAIKPKRIEVKVN